MRVARWDEPARAAVAAALRRLSREVAAVGDAAQVERLAQLAGRMATERVSRLQAEVAEVRRRLVGEEDG